MLYLDSSAIVKLVIREPETSELVKVVREEPTPVASALAVTEVTRAIVRSGGSQRRADPIVRGLGLVPIDEGILRSAAQLRPTSLRALDAIHLATALSLGHHVSRFVTYDERLGGAASVAGLDVIAPG